METCRLVWLSGEAFASVVSDVPVVQLDMQVWDGIVAELASCWRIKVCR